MHWMDGYAQISEGQTVPNLFLKLTTEGIDPDLSTFLTVLHACSHAGLTEEREVVFNYINIVYQLIPTPEHYACVVDLFSQAGYINKKPYL